MDATSGMLELCTSGFYYMPVASDDQKSTDYKVEVDTLGNEAAKPESDDSMEV